MQKKLSIKQSIFVILFCYFGNFFIAFWFDFVIRKNKLYNLIKIINHLTEWLEGHESNKLNNVITEKLRQEIEEKKILVEKILYIL